MKLFSIPYAFGSSYCYNELGNYLNKNIQLVPLDYPGHGKRIADSLLYDVNSIADDLYQCIKSSLTSDDKYALLGYSMGGLVCYELLKRLKNFHDPECVFIIASHYPDYQYENDTYEKYALNDVKALLKEYGGTSAEALESDELLDFMKPIVCADMIALRDYKNTDHDFQIRCPVTFIGGTAEEYTAENILEWKKIALNGFDSFQLEGEHFFLFNCEENLTKTVAIIMQKLTAIAEKMIQK